MEYAFSWLDVKLGMRMMRKFPGVSLVIVFALAIGIPVSLMPNHLFDAAMGQSPPFDQGERVLGVVGFGQEGRTALRVGDYELLRERLETLGGLGAAIPVEVNVISGDASGDLSGDGAKDTPSASRPYIHTGGPKRVRAGARVRVQVVDGPRRIGIVRVGMSVTIGVSLLAMLLSTTALYALMSMTVRSGSGSSGFVSPLAEARER